MIITPFMLQNNWYEEEARRWGLPCRLRMESSFETVTEVVWAARLAAHFGRLALGQSQLVSNL